MTNTNASTIIEELSIRAPDGLWKWNAHHCAVYNESAPSICYRVMDSFVFRVYSESGHHEILGIKDSAYPEHLKATWRALITHNVIKPYALANMQDFAEHMLSTLRQHLGTQTPDDEVSH